MHRYRNGSSGAPRPRAGDRLALVAACSKPPLHEASRHIVTYDERTAALPWPGFTPVAPKGCTVKACTTLHRLRHSMHTSMHPRQYVCLSSAIVASSRNASTQIAHIVSKSSCSGISSISKCEWGTPVQKGFRNSKVAPSRGTVKTLSTVCGTNERSRKRQPGSAANRFHDPPEPELRPEAQASIDGDGIGERRCAHAPRRGQEDQVLR